MFVLDPRAPEYRHIFSYVHMWIVCCHVERVGPTDSSEKRSKDAMVKKLNHYKEKPYLK